MTLLRYTDFETQAIGARRRATVQASRPPWAWTVSLPWI
jgi:hypothetical protein